MGRGKVILRYPAKQVPSGPVTCPTDKDRFPTKRAAECAWRHLMVTATGAQYEIERCGQCKDWHVEWAGLT